MVASLVASTRGNEDTKNERINQSHHGYSGTLPTREDAMEIDLLLQSLFPLAQQLLHCEQLYNERRS